MQALQYSRHGDPRVLQHEHAPDPQPGPGDVLIKVQATGVNRLDIVQRNGWYTLPGFQLPHIAGMDITGEVVEVGDAVARSLCGQRVVVDPALTGVASNSCFAGWGDAYGRLGILGGTHPGGYAELCAAPASHLYLVPDAMPATTAGAFATVWVTAFHSLTEIGELQDGETVLITGAGASLAMAAIQLAQHLGATVIALARTPTKRQRATELGAVAALDPADANLLAQIGALTDGRGVDMVLDHVGGAGWSDAISALAPGGRLVSCGNSGGDNTTIDSIGAVFHKRIRILGAGLYTRATFGRAWEIYAQNAFAPCIDSQVALAKGSDAQQKMEQGEHLGKLMLIP